MWSKSALQSVDGLATTDLKRKWDVGGEVADALGSLMNVGEHCTGDITCLSRFTCE